MLQNRLSNLAILSIENYLVKSSDITAIVDKIIT